MRLHLAASFTHDAGGRLRTVNEPGGQPAPRFFLGRTAEGNEWRFRHDLAPDLVAALEDLCAREPIVEDHTRPVHGLEESERLLARHAPIENIWMGPAFVFADIVTNDPETVRVTERNRTVLMSHFEDWIGDVEECQPFVAYVVDETAVSLCASVRTSTEAHEAGVETAVEHRGHGYAMKAAASWAVAVRETGRVPLYSTSWENRASRSVAAKLGLIQYGSTLHLR